MSPRFMNLTVKRTREKVGCFSSCSLSQQAAPRHCVMVACGSATSASAFSKRTTTEEHAMCTLMLDSNSDTLMSGFDGDDAVLLDEIILFRIADVLDYDYNYDLQF